MFKDNKKINTIKLLESLKTAKSDLYKGNALAFASKTMELIKKSVGKESEQFRLMNVLLYDQTAANLERTIYPADTLIVTRVNMDDNFDSIIDSCINFTNSFGTYKPPTDKKNILGDFDNKMIWSIFGLIILASFGAGIIATNWQLSKYLNHPVLNEKASQPKTQSDKKLPDSTLTKKNSEVLQK